MIKTTKRKAKPIAYYDGIITKENLPYPIVYYPGFYGSFFAFKPNTDSPLFFCSCAKTAIENYIGLRLSRPIPQFTDRSRMFVLDSQDFPLSLVSQPITVNKSMGKEVLEQLHFSPMLCHKCNQALPSLRYCHAMYGTVFIQSYGWYVNQTYFRFGISPRGELAYLPAICPQEYQIDIQAEDRKELAKKIENVIRQEFGIYKIGERWISETILYQVVKRVFPGEVIFHYRPEWLSGLELDIYIPDTKTAIEYQGIQHYQPIQHWGGQKALEDLRQRDMQKASLCQRLGIKLLTVSYIDPLTENYIRTLLEA